MQTGGQKIQYTRTESWNESYWKWSNYVETKLHEESLHKNKTFENFKEYSVYLKKTLISVSVECINKAIESMANPLYMVVKKHGKQIKY